MLALVGCAASTPTPAPDLPPPPASAAPAPVEPAPQPVAVASSAVPVAPASVAPAPAASAPAASPPEGLPAFGAGKGTASFSNPNNKGSCSLNPPSNRNTLSASRNIYQSIQACGACLEITGGAGTAVVQVMDLCFSCPDNSVVISKPAFEATVGKQSGTGDISWKTVPCPVETKVTVRIKESSTRHWTAVQIRDSKLPLKSVSLQRDGESDWVTLERSADNYWAAAKGAGEGGFKLRIVAASGQQIEESVAKGWKDGKVYPGVNQF
jgi:expansin